MKKSLLSAIIDHLFGTKYYFVVLRRKAISMDVQPCQLCSYVFYSRDLAWKYVHESVYGRAAGSYELVTIKSFRSKEKLHSDYNPHHHLDYSKFE